MYPIEIKNKILRMLVESEDAEGLIAMIAKRTSTPTDQWRRTRCDDAEICFVNRRKKRRVVVHDDADQWTFEEENGEGGLSDTWSVKR